jgi:hypothetical protein
MDIGHVIMAEDDPGIPATVYKAFEEINMLVSRRHTDFK